MDSGRDETVPKALYVSEAYVCKSYCKTLHLFVKLMAITEIYQVPVTGQLFAMGFAPRVYPKHNSVRSLLKSDLDFLI